jgi:hypothetical protein
VPKCEIFDGSHLHDFYIINPFWGETLGLKCNLVILIFRGTRHHLISDAHAQRTH